jgi:hypothetical protein
MDRMGVPEEGRFVLPTNDNQAISVGWKRDTLDLKTKFSVAIIRIQLL